MPRKRDEVPNIPSAVCEDPDNTGQHFATTKSIARKRWKILARALLKDDREEVTDVSVRRFTSFGILAPVISEGDWYEYSTPDKNYSVNVRRPSKSPTAQDLMGFNNTGNICVWPSEETLAVFITANLDIFKGKTVLELGGGMSCMAGLILAKYSLAEHVNVTDGNPKSIENVRSILKKNRLQERVSCSVLQWETVRRDPAVAECYDVVLVADCLFFDEVREDLILTIFTYLSPSGVAYVMAPQRGDTLCQFITFSESFGLVCEKYEKYNDAIWERHLELLKTSESYDPSLHYPILLKMTKSI